LVDLSCVVCCKRATASAVVKVGVAIAASLSLAKFLIEAQCLVLYRLSCQKAKPNIGRLYTCVFDDDAYGVVFGAKLETSLNILATFVCGTFLLNRTVLTAGDSLYDISQESDASFMFSGALDRAAAARRAAISNCDHRIALRPQRARLFSASVHAFPIKQCAFLSDTLTWVSALLPSREPSTSYTECILNSSSD
jgi:hypothetical protein